MEDVRWRQWSECAPHMFSWSMAALVTHQRERQEDGERRDEDCLLYCVSSVLRDGV